MEYFTKYPTIIEVPEDYWTVTTTINTEANETNIHWHHNEDE